MGERERESQRGSLMSQRVTEQVELDLEVGQEEEFYLTVQEREDINSLKRFDFFPTMQARCLLSYTYIPILTPISLPISACIIYSYGINLYILSLLC